jgi:hypothetical protein
VRLQECLGVIRVKVHGIARGGRTGGRTILEGTRQLQSDIARLNAAGEQAREAAFDNGLHARFKLRKPALHQDGLYCLL